MFFTETEVSHVKYLCMLETKSLEVNIMSGFNNYTRKEDVSTRLKAHSLRNAKDQTKNLETESRKMEERLKELKLAMSREKEERERQGGIFWKSGQQGALANHAQNVLNRPPAKPKDKGQRTRKIKVLKETPIETPNRSKQPGTMAYIAQREAGSSKDNRSKGPKCGQCEQKAVSVSCMECSENYCAQCFAAFHMKGALRKHRSVPFKVGVRPTPSPRPLQNAQPTHSSYQDNMMSERKELQYNSMEMGAASSQNGHGEMPSGEEAPFNGPSLLDGAYDEQESAQSFQDALKAWRSGEGSQDDVGGNALATPRKKNSPMLKARAVTPVKSPIVIIESSTSTSNDNIAKTQDIDIKFNSAVSYTEKLLLKQHRRQEVDSLQLSPRAERMSLTPRLNSARSSYRGDSVSPYSRRLGSPRTSRKYDVSDEDRVDFQSLFQAVSRENRKQQSTLQILEPGLKIEDISQTSGSPDSSQHTFYGLEEASHYQVEETNDAYQSNTNSFVSVKPATQMKDTVIIEPVDHLSFPTEPAYNDDQNRCSSRAVSQVYAFSYVDPKARPQSTSQEQNLKSDNNNRNNSSNHRVAAESRPKSSAKNRPESRTRPRSSKEKRPKSRVSSRASVVGGGLTKHPSDTLSEIARMTPVELPEHHGLSEFFTAGVDLTPPDEEKVIVPSADKAKPLNQRPESAKKITVSNKLYQMAPRNWRPDSSLGSNVDDSAVYMFYQDFNIRDFLSDPPVEDSLDGESTISFSLNAEPPTLSGRTSLESYRETSRNRHVTDQSGANVPSPVQEGRHSRAIVVDGDDMSTFDFKDSLDGQNVDDAQTLDQLEWELASESGRITADGKISRVINLSPTGEENDLDIGEDNGHCSGLSSEGGYDISDALSHRNDELMDDFEDNDENVENEVKALF